MPRFRAMKNPAQFPGRAFSIPVKDICLCLNPVSLSRFSFRQSFATGNLATSEALELAQVVEIYLHALAARGFDERLTKVEEMALSNREPEFGRTIQLPSTRS